MPSHTVHTFMDRVFFGKSYWRLHDFIDSAYFVVGRWHRKYYHDFYSAITIGKNLYPNDSQASDAAVLHILLDDVCSYYPDLKKLLEKKAKEYYRNIRRTKRENRYKKKIKVPYELEVLVCDLKKSLEARRWHDRFYGIR